VVGWLFGWFGLCGRSLALVVCLSFGRSCVRSVAWGNNDDDHNDDDHNDDNDDHDHDHDHDHTAQSGPFEAIVICNRCITDMAWLGLA